MAELRQIMDKLDFYVENLILMKSIKRLKE